MMARLAARLTRDKADTLLLLAAALLVLLPHFHHLPAWASGVVCLTLLWRGLLTWQGKRLPPLWLLLPVSVLAMGGVYLSHKTLLGREAGVTMLALLLTFKLLEMHARRDLFVVVFLSFFLLLTQFFYSQSVLTALLMALSMVLLLATQLTFQYTGAVPALAARLRLAGKMVLLAAPLGMLLFLAFPRIQGPLWSLPGDGRSGRSGISDSMAPGAMTNLALSEEIAFRVRFDHAAPPQQALYWRGPVLSHYDGRTWRRRSVRLDAAGLRQMRPQLLLPGPGTAYQVTLEPGEHRFLFALELSEAVRPEDGARSETTDALEHLSRGTAERRLRYSGRAHTDYALRVPPAARELELPPDVNPRSRALGARLQTVRAQEGDMAAVRQVLDMFRQQDFEYTLEPSLLGRHAVDEFLFRTRSGFCEHYSGAFVFLMRASGLPARVVTGYQGGELNPVDGFYTVRQSDAHAWGEVWLGPARGWVRIDPTAAVAPERIRSSLAQALPDAGAFGLQNLLGLGRNQDSWLGQLRFQFNALNNAWNQWILDYNPRKQQYFFSELGAALADWRLVAALALLMLLAVLAQRRQSSATRDPVDRAYAAFCRHLLRHGIERAPDEGPLHLAQRVRRLDLPREQIAAMTEFLALYGALKYGAPHRAATDNPVARLNRLLKQLR